jgi:thimet oligopeptidase
MAASSKALFADYTPNPCCSEAKLFSGSSDEKRRIPRECGHAKHGRTSPGLAADQRTLDKIRPSVESACQHFRADLRFRIRSALNASNLHNRHLILRLRVGPHPAWLALDRHMQGRHNTSMAKYAPLQVLACLLFSSAFGWAGVCPSVGVKIEKKDFWTGKPSIGDLNTRVDSAVNSITTQINLMTEISGAHTVQNTLCPYDRAGWFLDLALSQMALLRVAHPDGRMRQAAALAEQRLEQLKSGLRLNHGVFVALSALDLNKEDPATRWYVEREIRAYKLAGVDRDEAARRKIVALRNELVGMGQQFQKNMVDDGSQIVVKRREDLRGLPPDFFRTHPGQPDGSILLTTDPGTAFPVITYAQNALLRAKMLHAFVNQGYPANRELLRQIAAKRAELTHALGYDNWADYASADLMSGSSEIIRAFISEIDDATREGSARYVAELLALKRKDDPAAKVLAPDDLYYEDQLKRSRHAFNAQELRPYFPYEQTEKGLLDTAARLFHVTVSKVSNDDVWDPSVSTWEVFDRGKRIGRFFLDMHPRAGKDKGGVTKSLRAGIAGEQIPESVLICNYTGSQPGALALLDHSEVVSMFHELGHLMNLMLGTQRWAGLSGIASERDFAEVPSQIIEEWMNDPGVLQQFAKHYQSGQIIPAFLVESLNRADHASRAYSERIQIFLSAFSLKLFSSKTGTVDPDQLWKETDEYFFHEPHDPDDHGYVSSAQWIKFTSNYYTYSWDRAIKSDFLDQFDRHNLMADGPAWKYRRTILEPGASKPARDLVQDFLGRPQRIDAYRRWINEEYATAQ